MPVSTKAFRSSKRRREARLRGRVPCHALESAPYRIRLDGPRWPRRQPAVSPEFPMPGQWGRDDAVGVLSGDGERRQCRAPVHDASMIEGPADAIDEIVARTQEAMAEASAIVLDGFRLQSDASIVRWPDRYMDARGREFWGRVMKLRNEKFEIETSRKNTPGRLAGVVPTSSTLPCLTTDRREGSTKRQRRELSMCPHEAC
jgi:hypothetical protein